MSKFPKTPEAVVKVVVDEAEKTKVEEEAKIEAQAEEGIEVPIRPNTLEIDVAKKEKVISFS